MYRGKDTRLIAYYVEGMAYVGVVLADLMKKKCLGYSVRDTVNVLKGVWYIYDWDTGWLVLMWLEALTAFSCMSFTR